MGQKKSGYVTDESGNRVIGQGMRPGPFENPIPEARAFDNTRIPDYENAYVEHVHSYAAGFPGAALDRASVIADFRRQLRASDGGLDFVPPPVGFPQPGPLPG